MTESVARLRLVFCGTPQFAVPTLEVLIAAGHELALVVTQPDRPVGRKQVLTAPPVKQSALAHGLEITQPEKIKNNAEFRARLDAINAPLQTTIAALTKALRGRSDARALDGVTRAVVDLPNATIRRYMRDSGTLPSWLERDVAAATRRLLER